MPGPAPLPQLEPAGLGFDADLHDVLEAFDVRPGIAVSHRDREVDRPGVQTGDEERVPALDADDPHRVGRVIVRNALGAFGVVGAVDQVRLPVTDMKVDVGGVHGGG
ncbi:hypothetical protein BKM31_49635 [[Actinomadura] parvosata subsp. kistnae]|uniref:Uncharacterized protein n=1 Tax=[Actinomadura] parvosata subsp. kistnae TaxID=1909395 RepID=A0A1V0AE20_9ACTN|nr:hypothetical protein [Nonomuraea sp. ATCC 55076]AQZ68471.1 hypothetical protein BKM31_49635 [Nonomuraea sp. ATCC 55076]